MLLIWLLESAKLGDFNPSNQQTVPIPQPLIKHMLVSTPLYVADSVLSDLNTSVIKRTDIAAVIQLILLKRRHDSENRQIM